MKINNQSKLNMVCWIITTKCNICCPICYGYKSDENSDIDLQMKIIDRIVEIGIKGINFSGGEPLLDEGLINVIRYAKAKGLYTKLSTNGTLLTEQIIDEFNNCLDKLSISLDGSTPEVYGCQRSSNRHFHTVLKRLNQLRKRKFLLDVATVITAVNFTDLDNIARIISENRIDRWCLFRFVDCECDNEVKTHFQITDRQFDQIKQKIGAWKKLFKIPAVNLRDSSDEQLRAFLFLSPRGNVLMHYSSGYSNIGNLFEINDLEKLLSLNGFNYRGHALKYWPADEQVLLKKIIKNKQIIKH